MLKNENITSDYFSNKNNIIFSFGKSDKINENSNNKMKENLVNNENKNNNKGINDRETCDSKFLKCISIYKLLNKNKNPTKENSLPLFNLNNINQSNNTTKPKIEVKPRKVFLVFINQEFSHQLMMSNLSMVTY